MGKKKYSLYTKRGVFYVQWYDKGRKIQKSTKTKDRATAEKIAQELFAASVMDTSVDNIADRWIYYHQFDRAERTKKDVRIYSGKFSDWLFKKRHHRDASQVDKKTLFDYRMYQEQKLNYAQTTVGIHFRTIKSVFNWAFAEGLIENAPFEHFKIPKPKRKELVITRTEMRAILQAAKESNYLHYLYIKFMSLTGCRKGEFENLKLRDIGTMFIYLTGKTGRRQFRASKEILDVICEIRKNVPLQRHKGAYLFINENGVWLGKHGAISKIFKKYVRQCGLNDAYTLHTIRHSMISYHLAAGVNAYVVKDLAGHTSIKTTEWYSHLPTRDQPNLQWW